MIYVVGTEDGIPNIYITDYIGILNHSLIVLLSLKEIRIDVFFLPPKNGLA